MEMKIQRININIPRNRNNHPYLYNQALALMNKAKVGGVISNDGIKINGIEVKFLEILNKAKIYFHKQG